MTTWSRRDILRVTAATAAAVPLATLPSLPAGAAEARPSTGSGGAAPLVSGDGPVVVRVDPGSGEVAVYHGFAETVVVDPGLAARVLLAADVRPAR